jgi:hypothetical protein
MKNWSDFADLYGVSPEALLNFVSRVNALLGSETAQPAEILSAMSPVRVGRKPELVAILIRQMRERSKPRPAEGRTPVKAKGKKAGARGRGPVPLYGRAAPRNRRAVAASFRTSFVRGGRADGNGGRGR